MLVHNQWIVDYSEVHVTPTQLLRGKLQRESGL
jgi:hypothetical protein